LRPSDAVLLRPLLEVAAASRFSIQLSLSVITFFQTVKT